MDVFPAHQHRTKTRTLLAAALIAVASAALRGKRAGDPAPVNLSTDSRGAAAKMNPTSTARWAMRVTALTLVAIASGAGTASAASAEPAASTTGASTTAPAPNNAALVTVGSGSTLLERHRQFVATKAGVSPSAVNCWDQIWIWNLAAGRYVSTEVGYSDDDHALLRARSTVVGPWERYGVCRDSSTGLTDFVSDANGAFVSAELGYSGDVYGLLRARAAAIGPWELFYTATGPGGGYTYIFSQANGRYVSAELGYSDDYHNLLRARATAYGPWEVFYW